MQYLKSAQLLRIQRVPKERVQGVSSPCACESFEHLPLSILLILIEIISLPCRREEVEESGVLTFVKFDFLQTNIRVEL